METSPYHLPGGPPALDETFIETAHARIAKAMPAVTNLTPDMQPCLPHILLVYTQKTPLPDGLTLTHITRAVVNAAGEVIKLSTSRG